MSKEELAMVAKNMKMEQEFRRTHRGYDGAWMIASAHLGYHVTEAEVTAFINKHSA